MQIKGEKTEFYDNSINSVYLNFPLTLVLMLTRHLLAQHAPLNCFWLRVQILWQQSTFRAQMVSCYNFLPATWKKVVLVNLLTAASEKSRDFAHYDALGYFRLYRGYICLFIQNIFVYIFASVCNLSVSADTCLFTNLLKI